MVARNERGEFVPWVKGAVAVVGVILPILAIGTGSVISHYLDSVAGDLARLERKLEFQEGIIRSLSDAIARDDARTITLSEKIQELITKPSSRPDPFTGTDGRKLELRIIDLEHCCKQHGSMP